LRVGTVRRRFPDTGLSRDGAGAAFHQLLRISGHIPADDGRVGLHTGTLRVNDASRRSDGGGRGSRSGIERARHWFDRYGGRAVFIGRLLPVVRTFISLPAGYARMPPVRFGVYTAAGCVPWIGGLAWAGYAAGANWQHVQHLVNTPAYIIAGLIALLVIAGIIAVIVRRRKRPPPARPRSPADPMSMGTSQQRRTS
jgi:hypothetical protein